MTDKAYIESLAEDFIEKFGDEALATAETGLARLEDAHMRNEMCDNAYARSGRRGDFLHTIKTQRQLIEVLAGALQS